MATTKLDFLHLRTTAGLASQINRVARRMRWKHFQGHLATWEERLKEARWKGRIDLVEKAFEEILKILRKKEHYLHIIGKDELIILNEEEGVAKKQLVLENELRPFLDELAKNKPELYAEFQKKIDTPLKKVCTEIHETTDKIRRSLAFLKADNVAGENRQDFLNSMKSDNSILRKIGREARHEKKFIKDEKSGLRKIYGDLDAIAALIKKDKKQAEKKLEELFKIEEKVFTEMKYEAQFIADMITKDAYLYIHIVDFIVNKLPKSLNELQVQNFSVPVLKKLREEEKAFLDFVYKHINDMYGLGRYTDIHAK